MPGYTRIVARRFGGPEELVADHVADLPEPGPGEVRLRVTAAGVGYTDTILRRGRYAGYTGGLPAVPGYDVVGTVDALGPQVAAPAPGDLVADMSVSGGYSQYIVLAAADLIPVPAGVPAALAVDVPLMWVTAWQMLTRVAPPPPGSPPGSPLLVVGAGGAVGRALVMLALHRGHQVIGTCSAANMPAVAALGASAIDHRRDDLVAAIRAAGGGAGVAAAFDAIGGASWDHSWQALAPGGRLVAYGFQDFLDHGGPPDAAAQAMRMLNETWPEEGRRDGSGRSTAFYDISMRRRTHPDEYRADARTLLDLIAAGTVRPPTPELLPLDAAAAAHRRIAAGGLDHRLVLTPWG